MPSAAAPRLTKAPPYFAWLCHAVGPHSTENNVKDWSTCKSWELLHKNPAFQLCQTCQCRSQSPWAGAGGCRLLRSGSSRDTCHLPSHLSLCLVPRRKTNHFTWPTSLVFVACPLLTGMYVCNP